MKKLYSKLIIFFILIIINTSFTFPQNPSLNDIDDYVSKTLKEFRVPGMAVGIVKNGKLIFAKGFGLKNIETKEPVDANTLFQIASNTKAFTSACLAILVDEGKLSWDDRVVDHLPGFQMSDPYVTKEMRIRDLLCHRSGLGLGAGDLLYFPKSDYTREQILYQLRYIKLKTSFRSAYAYDNILYPVAGELIKAVSGKTWEEFVQQKIFNVLGMNSSRVSASSLKKEDNVATPYSIVKDSLTPIKMHSYDNIGPAGSILSNINDLAKWITVQLDSGRIEYKGSGSERLFTEKQNKEMWKPHTIIPMGKLSESLSAAKTNFMSYGLGLRISEFRGNKIVWHTGSLGGMVTRITMMPDKKLGVIVLTNQESGAAFNSITYHILDLFLNAKTDWIKGYSELVKKHRNTTEEKILKMDSLRAKDTNPSLQLEKYAGKFKDDWYGTITIKYDNEKLILSFDHSPELIGKLEHWQYDTFVAHWVNRSLHADAFVTFSLKPDGSIDEIKMKPFRPDTDFSFDFQDLLFMPIE